MYVPAHFSLDDAAVQAMLDAPGSAELVTCGPDSPSWYASKAEHGRVVPTWNYVTAHVHGAVTVRDDADWTADVVRRLTELHEGGRWRMEDAPEKFITGQLRPIVGVEVRIERVVAKAKLSQNRPAADVDGVIAGLRGVGDHRGADAVAAHRR